jgi:multimeric flavodoxin WrbA
MLNSIPYLTSEEGIMKVIAFVGSPRKRGNTDTLVDRFLEGAKSTGADTEKIYLYDCTINPCQGCYKNCWTTPNDCTRWADDMQSLIPKMITSDLILFASPVYMASYTSQLTAFFERCIPVMHVDLKNKVIIEHRLRGKNAVMALVHDLPDPAVADLPFKALENVLAKQLQMNIVGKLHVPGVRDEGDIKKKEDKLQEAYQLGVKLCTP